jgi:flagellar L-ring protein FlgH
MNKPSSSRFKAHRWCRLLVVALGFVLLPATALSQSLWRDDVSKPMFADKRASMAGDIVTIVVQETTSTSKDNKTATAKSVGMDASISSLFYSPTASGLLTKGGQLPALKYSSKNDFSGGGTINNSEKILTYVAAQVIDVLPNRNLVIEGRRETSFSGEQQTIVLRGVVRADDVTAGNTVLSYNIADASIHLVSKGQLSDSQRKGWFTRIWDKVTPF